MKSYNIYFYDEKSKTYFLYCRQGGIKLEHLTSMYKNSKHSGYISNLDGKILRRF